MGSTVDIQYGPARLLATCEAEVLAKVRQDLEPFFTFGTGIVDEDRIATLIVRTEDPIELPSSADGVPIAIDTSLYKHLASTGRRWGDENLFVVRIDLTGTQVEFDRRAATITLWQSDHERAVIDTVRTIKSLFTPALEQRGSVQLHSSGVVDAEGGVLILGDMWQGKTTLLLELLEQFDVAQLSCDTVVAWEGPDTRVAARGWPSPFSMSLGTMSDHQQLYGSYPADQRKVPYDVRWRERKKVVLTSAEIVRLFGTTLIPGVPHVRHVLIARFQPEEETRLQPLQSEAELIAHIRAVYLGSRDPIYHNWHGYVVCPEAQIDANIENFARALTLSAEIHIMTWAPSATSLLKRIPRFARLHKTMRRIVDY